MHLHFNIITFKVLFQIKYLTGFMFHTVPPEERIDASDAEIVDVIHTAGLWVGTDGVVSAWNEFTLKLRSGERTAHISAHLRSAKSKQV